MNMSIECRMENGLMHAVSTGEFSLEEAQSTFLDLLETIKENGCHKVLFDGREIDGDPMIVERFYYGEFCANAVEKMIRDGWAGISPQFAYVLHEPLLDPLRLGETVAVNRGMNVKAFSNTKEAMQWLFADRPD